jgi:hypothetical protein
MFSRTFALVLATVVWCSTACCQPKVTLEVQPSCVDISPWYQRLQALVVLQNAGTEVLVRPKLVSFTNDSFQVRLDPTPVQRLDGQTLGDFAVTHANCMRLVAGILGRLYGGTLDTYRSHSVRDQIKRTYLDSVNAVRSAVGMPALS